MGSILEVSEILVRVKTQSRQAGQDLAVDWGYQEGKGDDSQVPIYSLRRMEGRFPERGFI